MSKGVKSQREPALLDVLLKFVTIISVAVGAIAVYIALRNNSRQLGAQIFLSYSVRLHSLRQTLAPELDVYSLTGELPCDIGPEIRRTIAAVFFLIFEFHSLRQRGYVANSIWSIWETDMARLLTTPTFSREWSIARSHFDKHPHFCDWIGEMHGKSAPLKD